MIKTLTKPLRLLLFFSLRSQFPIVRLRSPGPENSDPKPTPRRENNKQRSVTYLAHLVLCPYYRRPRCSPAVANKERTDEVIIEFLYLYEAEPATKNPTQKCHKEKTLRTMLVEGLKVV